jgi:hypothetical protein
MGGGNEEQANKIKSQGWRKDIEVVSDRLSNIRITKPSRIQCPLLPAPTILFCRNIGGQVCHPLSYAARSKNAIRSCWRIRAR